MCCNKMWKSVNFILASCRLICPTAQRCRRTSNQGTLGPDSTLNEPFGLSSAAGTQLVYLQSDRERQVIHIRCLQTDRGTQLVNPGPLDGLLLN